MGNIGRNFHKKVYSSKYHDFENFKVLVNRKSIRKIYITVKKSSGSVIVNAPRSISDSVIYEFVNSKLSWIKNHLEKFEIRKLQEDFSLDSQPTISFIKSTKFLKNKTLVNKNEAESNNSSQLEFKFDHTSNLNEHLVCFFGQKIVFEILKVDDCRIKTPKIYFDQDQQKIFFQISSDFFIESEQKLRKCLENFCRIELKKVIVDLVEKWQKIIAVEAKFVGIKKMKTRWGSCNVKRARIWFSLELLKKPMQAVEYVVVHELVHLIEASHNKRFVFLLTKFLPNWKKSKSLLED